ncbi:hypothetical protein E2R51_09470 [Jeotgalibacillus sp. S-D1]|uniref:hypothetical protein n=1 Tax=Jeotgalibacillus sp. S-D1 TaxID=2552189 RepID=UPI00105954D6|nr:hypothetical protein [Jeotgalibacillus sp. S-D1]TDL32883.1 hypothetical protein E2R51_09470 [Jeotgalibacillus sp. S-D1]
MVVEFLLPLLLIIASVYWTMKVPYSKRFLPIVILILLAILVFIVPLILASLDVISGGFGIAIISIYFSVSLVVGTLVNLIVVFTIKKR